MTGFVRSLAARIASPQARALQSENERLRAHLEASDRQHLAAEGHAFDLGCKLVVARRAHADALTDLDKARQAHERELKAAVAVHEAKVRQARDERNEFERDAASVRAQLDALATTATDAPDGHRCVWYARSLQDRANAVRVENRLALAEGRPTIGEAR